MLEAFEQLRRRAPPTLDFDALVENHRAYNDALMANWRERFPASDSAVLEMVLPASGQARRRLKRYRELSGARLGTPGRLTFREATSFRFLTLKTVTIASAAARADARLEGWRLLTVEEALAATP